MFAKKQARNEESGDDEEDVYPDKASRWPREEVIQYDSDDGDHPQALNVWSKSLLFRPFSSDTAGVANSAIVSYC